MHLSRERMISNILRLTNSHVKTRRLYYLYKIAQLLQAKNTLSKQTLITDLKKWAEENKNHLRNHIDQTGEISTLKAGERYLNLSKELGLISFVGTQFVNTIDGTVLSKFKSVNEEPYKLFCELKCFLLKKLLEKDFDYLVPIASLIMKEEDVNFLRFKERFSRHLKASRLLGTPVEGLMLLREMEKWKSPEKFFQEHIFAPRIGWFLDLELLDWEKFKAKSKIEFTDQTREFLMKLESTKQNKLLEYLDNNYYNQFANVGKIGKFDRLSELPDKQKKRKIVEYLQRVFSDFETTLTKSISSRSFFEYTACYALCREQLICERKDMERAILEISASGEAGYRYRKVEEISKKGVKTEAGYITEGT